MDQGNTHPIFDPIPAQETESQAKARHTAMIAFAEACENAIAQCPQHRTGSGARLSQVTIDILQNRITKEELFTRYLKDETLWHGGYFEYLIPYAKSIFDNYAERCERVKSDIWTYVLAKEEQSQRVLPLGTSAQGPGFPKGSVPLGRHRPDYNK